MVFMFITAFVLAALRSVASASERFHLHMGGRKRGPNTLGSLAFSSLGGRPWLHGLDDVTAGNCQVNYRGRWIALVLHSSKTMFSDE